MMARQPGKVSMLTCHNLVRVSLSPKHPYLFSFVVSHLQSCLATYLNLDYSGIRGQIAIAKLTLLWPS